MARFPDFKSALTVNAVTTARFAITYTVKNEANLLPDAIAYHLGLGCSLIYVFFDGSTDNSRELIRDTERVRCADSVAPDSLRDVPAWIEALVPRWTESMDVRKRINTYVSAQMARNESIDWLINLDPDELLLLNPAEARAPGDPGKFFSEIPATVDQILVPNLEAVPNHCGSGRPFADCTLFLRRFPITELLWRSGAALIRRAIARPKLHAWYDYWFYRFRFQGALPRLMHHPTTGESIPAGYFLGYSNHKAFIRTRVARHFLFNIHRWQKAERRPKSISRGCLLHYDLCSLEYFREKFRQRPPAMLIKAFFCRHMFALIARDLSFESARKFFLENICITDDRILARLRRRGILVEISSISSRMKQRPIVQNGRAPVD